MITLETLIKNLSSGEKSLIIASNTFSRFFLNLRKDNPYLNFDIVPKEEIIHRYFGLVDPKGLPTLLKHGFSLSIAEEIINNAPYYKYVSGEKGKILLEGYDVLNEAFYIKKDEYIEAFLKNKKIYILGEKENAKELEIIFKDFNLSFTYVSYLSKNSSIPFYNFDYINDEIHFLMNSIARSIDEGKDINSIYIANANEEYALVLDGFAKLYGIPLEPFSKVQLITLGVSKKFLKLVGEMDIDTSIKKLEEDGFPIEDIKMLKDAIKGMDVSGVKQEELYHLFRTFFLHYYVVMNRLEKYVHYYRGGIPLDGDEIYIINANEKDLPAKHANNLFLSDKLRKEGSLSTSLDLNEIENDCALALLNFKNVKFISFSKATKSGFHLVSPLINKLDIVEPKISLDYTDYSEEYLKVHYRSLIDKKTLYGKVDEEYVSLKNFVKEFPTYNPAYKVDDGAVKKDEDIPYSYSSVDRYYKCPFSYYVNYILGIKDFEVNFGASLGSVLHYVLEHYYKDEDKFDFESCFNEACKKNKLGPKELVLAEKYKQILKEVISFNKLQEEGINNPIIEAEKEELKYVLNEHAYITGRVDKIISFTSGEDSYLTFIDYKSGDTSFKSERLQFGLSMQLPTYALLASGTSGYQNQQIFGLYIQQISPKVKFDVYDEHNKEKLYKELRLSGVTLDEEGVIANFNPTYSNSQYIKGLRIKKDGNLTGGIFTRTAIKDFIEITLDRYLEADKRIRENDFKIAPYAWGENEHACTFCKYKDICHSKVDDVKVDLKEMLEQSKGDIKDA